MRCIHPIRIRGGALGLVPCGKCNSCLANRRSDWSFRLYNELKVASSAYFLTYTYDDNHLPINDCGFPTLNLRDVQLFKKRLRKRQATFVSDRIRYYTVGEYGTIGDRPHYHSIMYNLHPGLVGEIPRLWTGGLCHVGTVTPASIAYVTKYVIEKARDYDGDRLKPFHSCLGVRDLVLTTYGRICSGIGITLELTLMSTVLKVDCLDSINQNFLLMTSVKVSLVRESNYLLKSLRRILHGYVSFILTQVVIMPNAYSTQMQKFVQNLIPNSINLWEYLTQCNFVSQRSLSLTSATKRNFPALWARWCRSLYKTCYLEIYGAQQLR